MEVEMRFRRGQKRGRNEVETEVEVTSKRSVSPPCHYYYYCHYCYYYYYYYYYYYSMYYCDCYF